MKMLYCNVVFCCVLMLQNAFGQGSPGPDEGGSGGSNGSASSSRLSLGVGLNTGSVTLASANGIVATNYSGNISLNLTTGVALTGTSGSVEVSFLTTDGLAASGQLLVGNGKWVLTYGAIPTEPQGLLSEVHGIVSGSMSTSGATQLSAASGIVAGSDSSSIRVFDDLEESQVDAVLGGFDNSSITGVGSVAMSARWGWNWNDFWIGCGAGAVAGGTGGGLVGAAAGGIGAVPGVAIGAAIGCVTGGGAAGVIGGSGATPNNTHVVQSICVGAVVGGVCGTVGVYIIPGPPPPPPTLGSDPATTWYINNLRAAAGEFNRLPLP